MKQQLTEFVKKQQEVIDEEMAEMSPEEVNDILSAMKPKEANKFLGKLGQIRSAAIYLTLSG